MTTTTRGRLGSTLVALGLALVLVQALLLVRPAGAASTTIVADTPVELAIEVSRAMVPDGSAGGVLLLEQELSPATWGVPAALATFPGAASLLLTPATGMPAAVVTEVERALAPNGVVHVVGMPAIASAGVARGWTVVATDAVGPVATSLALADQTWGVPGGTSQRLLGVAAIEGAHLLAGAANVHGVNLAIPVVAFGAGEAADVGVILREHLLVADPALVDDGAVGSEGSATTTRIFDADPSAVAATLAQLMDDDPKDGFLEPRLGRTVVAVEVDEDRPHPALLASVVAARDSLDGFNAALAFVSGPADLAALDQGNGVTFLGLSRGAPAPAPAPSPLPATGGGFVLGALLVAAGATLRRRT